jgi:hypothetical protein
VFAGILEKEVYPVFTEELPPPPQPVSNAAVLIHNIVADNFSMIAIYPCMQKSDSLLGPHAITNESILITQRN